MDHHQKRGTFPFKTLFHSFRYDFRLPRYRRAKTRLIFNRLLPPSSLLRRTSRSHLASLTYPKLEASVSRKKYRSVCRGPIHNIRAVLRNFESLYLSNELRYRDKSKSRFESTVSPIFWTGCEDIRTLHFIWQVPIFNADEKLFLNLEFRILSNDSLNSIEVSRYSYQDQNEIESKIEVGGNGSCCCWCGSKGRAVKGA